MRRVRKPPAELDERKSAMANGSTPQRQGVGSGERGARTPCSLLPAPAPPRPPAPRFHHPAQHGGGHEGTAVGAGDDFIDRRVGQRSGHRLGQAANVLRLEEAQSQVQRRADAAEDVVGGDFLRAETGHEQDVPAARHIAAAGKPMDDQLDGQFVGPLAVVQHDEGRLIGRARACPGSWPELRCCGLRRTPPVPGDSSSASPARWRVPAAAAMAASRCSPRRFATADVSFGSDLAAKLSWLTMPPSISNGCRPTWSRPWPRKTIIPCCEQRSASSLTSRVLPPPDSLSTMHQRAAARERLARPAGRVSRFQLGGRRRLVPSAWGGDRANRSQWPARSHRPQSPRQCRPGPRAPPRRTGSGRAGPCEAAAG